MSYVVQLALEHRDPALDDLLGPEGAVGLDRELEVLRLVLHLAQARVHLAQLEAVEAHLVRVRVRVRVGVRVRVRVRHTMHAEASSLSTES